MMPARVGRSVLKTGNSLAVALPPDWLRLFGIKDGDKVDLIHDSVIIIKPKKLTFDPLFLKKKFELIIKLRNIKKKITIINKLKKVMDGMNYKR